MLLTHSEWQVLHEKLKHCIAEEKQLVVHYDLQLSLLHPKTIVEGCLYLKGNGLLWSERNG